MHCGSVMDSLTVFLLISKIAYAHGRRQIHVLEFFFSSHVCFYFCPTLISLFHWSK